MAATHQHHSADIRAEAVKRVAAGEKRAAVARSMGLAHDTVCRWTRPNWIEHDGSAECPVELGVGQYLLVQLRCGELRASMPAIDFCWHWNGINGDIMRYTIIEP